jgi:BirA family biotin operon repressor/biotin-[acetyl-CoA-carboxylase] ligase
VDLGRPLVRLGEATSTNDIARVLAQAGVQVGAAVVADRQTAGRGRLGRVWASPRGGLWMSVLLRSDGPSPLGALSLAAGLAAADAITAATGLDPRLKWPNDVLLRGRKVAGVLIEAAADSLIVGIGVNVAIMLNDLPPDAAVRATSLHVEVGRPVSPHQVLQALLDRLAYWYGVWRAGGPVVQAWRDRDALRGVPLLVTLSDHTLDGVGDGVDDDGALRLRLSDGEVRRVTAGDVQAVARALGAV